jgi:hypothetical protein
MEKTKFKKNWAKKKNGQKLGKRTGQKLDQKRSGQKLDINWATVTKWMNQ